MGENTLFPLYTFEKDDWSMVLIENQDRVFYHIEPMDFENDEYLFWDAQGRDVRLIIDRKKPIKIEGTANEISLTEAFRRYSQVLGATVDLSGAPAEVWARLQANIKPESWRSRIARNLLGLGCLLIVLGVALVFIIGIVKAMLFR